MGYAWDTRGIYVCVGYVSVMYRLCVGYVTEETRSEGVNKKDNENNKHPCAGAQKSKLSKPQAGIFINNENNLDSTMRTIEIQQ